MATVHHPPTTGIGFRHNHEWLWLALGAILIALVASAITWAITSPDTVSEPEVASIEGFELDDETTAARFATPGVTLDFVGRNADPVTDSAATMGFELDDETTAARFATPGVTLDFVGRNADTSTGPLATMGFELDDETTAARFATPGVTLDFVGRNSDR